MSNSQLSYHPISEATFLNSVTEADRVLLNEATQSIFQLINAAPHPNFYCNVGSVISLAFECQNSELDSEQLFDLLKAGQGKWRCILRAEFGQLILFVQLYPDYVREAFAKNNSK